LANARRWGLGHPDDYAKTWSAIVGLPIEVGEKFYRRAKIHAAPIDATVIGDEQKTIDLYYRSGLIGRRIDASTVASAVFTLAIAAELAP
jgi:sulfonate transport system substrate-binding protein